MQRRVHVFLPIEDILVEWYPQLGHRTESVSLQQAVIILCKYGMQRPADMFLPIVDILVE